MKLNELLFEKNRIINSPCNGKGICGKCKVKLKDANAHISDRDREIFTIRELAEGYRLACQYEVEASFDVDTVDVVDNYNQDIEVLTINSSDRTYIYNKEEKGKNSIAVDIGTTTIAVCLVSNGEVIDSIGSVNNQNRFGADIISRIEAANEGRLEIMKRLVIENINGLIEQLCNRNNCQYESLNSIVVAGNTVMLHILQGLPLDGMAKYPFEVVSMEKVISSADIVFKKSECKNVAVILLPGIAPFVGADILSGILYLKMNSIKQEEKSLFVDLGTNGEMAIISNGRIYTTSTAAGPAFEGINISCGVAGIKGAIYDVNIEGNGRVDYKTIAGGTPVGVCGSGLVSIIAELFDKNIIDESGCFTDKYLDSGYTIVGNIKILSSDIRKFQMAKAAIRTGIEILIKKADIKLCELDKIYIAGGLGNAIDINKALKVGLIPEDSNCEVIAVGNSSLEGCVTYINNSNKCEVIITDIIEASENIMLGNVEEFNDLFLSYLNF